MLIYHKVLKKNSYFLPQNLITRIRCRVKKKIKRLDPYSLFKNKNKKLTNG